MPRRAKAVTEETSPAFAFAQEICPYNRFLRCFENLSKQHTSGKAAALPGVCTYLCFQVLGENRTRMGKISSLPASMPQDMTILLKSL